MRCSLQPNLTADEKLSLQYDLTALLHSDQLVGQLHLRGRVALVLDGRPYVLDSHSEWIKSAPSLYIGRIISGALPVSERLCVLLTLMQLVEPTPELTQAAQGAITRYLLGEYNEVRSHLVSAEGEVTGIAFNENQVASLIDGEWMLPNGETVDVTGEGWTVSGPLPAPVEEPVEADIQF